MEWIIKKNATLPVFQFEIARDGRSDFRKSNYILGTNFYISVYDDVTKKIKVASKPCYVTTSASTSNPDEIIYYVNYQFSKNETKDAGDYVAQISAINSQGTIVLPLKDKISISVLESFSLDFQDYQNGYVIERPCCPHIYIPINPIVVDCNVLLGTEDLFDLITEDGVYLTLETDTCPPLPCEISIISENGFDLISEYGQYLVTETNNC